jgi:ATP-dependent exoDNAse (exonuclease V) alpha subunit
MTGTNACGDLPVGLTQEYWDTGDTIHRLAAEQNGTLETSNVEDDGTKRVVNAMVSVEKDDHNTSSKAKLAKLAKLVKLAKSTALWCLLPYVPLTQEAKDKQRKVCPASNCGSKHP